jgi:uncharacterized protein (UPF0332 family)
MSKLQDKSDTNLDAAKLLHRESDYSSVAHCAYYSCYQLIKHIWLYAMDKSENDLELLIESINRTSKKKKGSHEILINQIGSYIKECPMNSALSDSRDFNNNVLQLKKLRTEADYKDSFFSPSNSSNSIMLAEKVLPILKKYQ